MTSSDATYRVCATCGFEQWTGYPQCHRCAARAFGRSLRAAERSVAICVTLAVLAGSQAYQALVPILFPERAPNGQWQDFVAAAVICVAFGSLGRRLGVAIERRRGPRESLTEPRPGG